MIIQVLLDLNPLPWCELHHVLDSLGLSLWAISLNSFGVWYVMSGLPRWIHWIVEEDIDILDILFD